MRGGSRRLLEEGLDIRRKLGDQVGIAAATRFLGQLALAEGNHATARRLQEECLGIERTLGNTLLVAADLASLAAIAMEEGDGAQATRLRHESTELGQALENAQAVAGEGRSQVAGVAGRRLRARGARAARRVRVALVMGDVSAEFWRDLAWAWAVGVIRPYATKLGRRTRMLVTGPVLHPLGPAVRSSRRSGEIARARPSSSCKATLPSLWILRRRPPATGLLAGENRTRSPAASPSVTRAALPAPRRCSSCRAVASSSNLPGAGWGAALASARQVDFGWR